MSDTATQVIDDCWNRIGVRGDGSCEQLAQHIDCRNCPVHARAAAELLDRLQVEQMADAWSEQAEPVQEQRAGLGSWLLFRIGEEWLALPTALLEEITEQFANWKSQFVISNASGKKWRNPGAYAARLAWRTRGGFGGFGISATGRRRLPGGDR